MISKGVAEMQPSCSGVVYECMRWVNECDISGRVFGLITACCIRVVSHACPIGL